MISIEEWLKPIILSLEGFSSTPTDEADAQNKIDELQNILEKLEDKEKTVQAILEDCEQYGSQYGDIQRFIRELLLGLNANIQVIWENQNIIRANLKNFKQKSEEIVEIPIEDTKVTEPIEQIPETIKTEEIEQPPVIENIEKVESKIVTEEVSRSAPEIIKPETEEMSTQTMREKSDNIMVIQSMNAEGETIQIYNVPSSYEEGKEDETNVTVEAKYVRGHAGEPKRASELVLKNLPKKFETTFVEPDETTTEIIVDPDGSKRIIVRKLTKTTQQIVSQAEYEGDTVTDHIRSQLGLSGTTHDFIIGTPDEQGLEQHTGIAESSIHAIIEHVSHRIIKKTRKIIKKITIIDGQEHITEEVIEEPDEVEEYNEELPVIEYDKTDFAKVEEKEIPMTEGEKLIEETQPDFKKPEEDIELLPVEEKECLQEIRETVKQDISQPEDITKSEGVRETDQKVFEEFIDAPVELIASATHEVEQLTPIECIDNIWPYETPYITHSTTTASRTTTELPAVTQPDQISQDIWPQNMTIGTNVDFNEYSFDRTLEISAGSVDNNQNIPVVDSVLEESATQEFITPSYETDMASRVDVEHAEIPEPLKSLEDAKCETEETKKIESLTPPITETNLEEFDITGAAEIIETQIETIVESQIVETIPVDEKHIEIIPSEVPSDETKFVADITEITVPILVTDDQQQPQLATTQIDQTLMFIEQERLSAQEKPEEILEKIVEQPQEPVLYESSDSQADIFLPEEMIVHEISPIVEEIYKDQPVLEASEFQVLETSQIIQEGDTSIIFEADRSLPEEIVKQIYEDIDTEKSEQKAPIEITTEQLIEEKSQEITEQKPMKEIVESTFEIIDSKDAEQNIETPTVPLVEEKPEIPEHVETAPTEISSEAVKEIEMSEMEIAMLEIPISETHQIIEKATVEQIEYLHEAELQPEISEPGETKEPETEIVPKVEIISQVEQFIAMERMKIPEDVQEAQQMEVEIHYEISSEVAAEPEKDTISEIEVSTKTETEAPKEVN